MMKRFSCILFCVICVISLASVAFAASFPITNFSYRTKAKTTRCIGEITNDSEKNYSMAIFKLSLYDNNGVLMDVADISIRDFTAGSTRSWEAICMAPLTGIAKYKVHLEMGM